MRFTRVKINALLVVFLLFQAGSVLFPAQAEDAKAKADKNWSLSLRGGLTLNAGNTKSHLISGGLKFALKSKVLEFLTTLETFYGSSKEQDIVNKGKWFSKLARKTEKRFNLFINTSLEYDEFAGIALRGSGGLGIQYNLANTEKNKAKLSAGVNGEFTDARDELDNTSSARLNLNYNLQKNLGETSNILIDVLYTSNLAHFFDDFRVEINASLSVLIKNPLSLKFEVQERYTHRPLEENLKKSDIILVTSLEISL
jgi:hypothetical protein